MAARKASKKSTRKAAKRSSKKSTAKKSSRKTAKKSSAKKSTARKAPAKKAPVRAAKAAPARSAAANSNYEVGALVLRLGLGIYFLWVGLLLALNNGFQDFFRSVLSSINASPTLFQLAFIGHLVIGFCLILGLFTRYAGILASIVTLFGLLAAWKGAVAILSGAGAVYMIKNLVIIAAGFSLWKTGSKEMSVDYAL